jgi:hypothetical protein
MTLRELMTAIDRRESLVWTVRHPTTAGSVLRTGVPYCVQKLDSGWYAVDVEFGGINRRLTLTPQPSHTSDPLDAELR